MLQRQQLLFIIAAAAAVVCALSVSGAMAANEDDEQPSKVGKVGAGLLLCSAGKVLLLKRNSKHNDNTWTVPGGNVEPADTSLLGTATREAMEELGGVPPFEVKSQILTKRGKRQQKHYTVFVADVDPAVQQAFVPQLDLRESREWRWVAWADVLAAAAAGSSDSSNAAEEFVLHPVVALLASQHANAVLSATQACPAADSQAAAGH